MTVAGGGGSSVLCVCGGGGWGARCFVCQPKEGGGRVLLDGAVFCVSAKAGEGGGQQVLTNGIA